jgi:hypothetical protein
MSAANRNRPVEFYITFMLCKPARASEGGWQGQSLIIMIMRQHNFSQNFGEIGVPKILAAESRGAHYSGSRLSAKLCGLPVPPSQICSWCWGFCFKDERGRQICDGGCHPPKPIPLICFDSQRTWDGLKWGELID